MFPMSDAFDQLLDAAIQHLQELKTRGVRHVSVSAEHLAALNAPARPASPKPAIAPAPAPRLESKPVAAPSAPAPRPAPAQAPSLDLLSGAVAAVSAPALSPEAKTDRKG